MILWQGKSARTPLFTLLLVEAPTGLPFPRTNLQSGPAGVLLAKDLEWWSRHAVVSVQRALRHHEVRTSAGVRALHVSGSRKKLPAHRRRLTPFLFASDRPCVAKSGRRLPELVNIGPKFVQTRPQSMNVGQVCSASGPDRIIWRRRRQTGPEMVRFVQRFRGGFREFVFFLPKLFIPLCRRQNSAQSGWSRCRRREARWRASSGLPKWDRPRILMRIGGTCAAELMLWRQPPRTPCRRQKMQPCPLTPAS